MWGLGVGGGGADVGEGKPTWTASSSPREPRRGRAPHLFFVPSHVFVGAWVRGSVCTCACAKQICYDTEHEDFVKEAVAGGPVMVRPCRFGRADSTIQRHFGCLVGGCPILPPRPLPPTTPTPPSTTTATTSTAVIFSTALVPLQPSRCCCLCLQPPPTATASCYTPHYLNPASVPPQILAPTHIASGALAGSTPQAQASQWRVSLDSMGRYMDRLAVTSGVAWVRCDQPYPVGAGTSQVWP